MAKRNSRTGEELDQYESSPVGKMFKERNFQLKDLGGNVVQWMRVEPNIDVIVSGVVGEPPLKLSDPVVVHVSRYNESEAVIKLRFATATAFFKSLDDAEDVEDI